MSACQVVLHKRGDLATGFSRRRRFLRAATATHESDIPELARAVRLVAACGFLVAAAAMPVLGEVRRSDTIPEVRRDTSDSSRNGQTSTARNTANFVSILCTGFEGPEWDLNFSVCGDEFALGTTCNYPVTNVCVQKNHAASQNCCHDDPNEETGWYMSPGSQHCSFPGIRDIHPAAGMQHLRFQYDPAAGSPPGCSGLGPSCQQQAITSHDPVPALSTTRWSYAIAISGTGGPTMIAETGEHTPSGGILLTSQTRWDAFGGLFINENLSGPFVHHADWMLDTPNYANYTIVLDPCNDTVTHSYGGVVVHTEPYGTLRPPTTDMGIYTTDHQPGQTIDIDCHCATHVPCTACGDNLLDPGEECDGVDDAACPGACQSYCMCPPPQCGCEPLPDGSNCRSTVCPNSNDLCRPTERVVDLVSGLTTVTKCDCVNAKECYTDIESDPSGQKLVADLSTGTTLVMTPDPVGTVDPDWIVDFTPTSGPPPVPAFSIPRVGNWCLPIGANWIDPYNNPVLANDPIGDYGFAIPFTLDFNAQKDFFLSIAVAADDSAIVFLNGNLVGATPGFSCANKVSIVTTTSSFFNHGANTVRVLVNNSGVFSPTPMGLLVEGGVFGTNKSVVCRGLHCPGTNEPCELTATENTSDAVCVGGVCVGGLTPGAACADNDDCPDKATVTYDCCPSSCGPLADGSGCEMTVCQGVCTNSIQPCTSNTQCPAGGICHSTTGKQCLPTEVLGRPGGNPIVTKCACVDLDDHDPSTQEDGCYLDPNPSGAQPICHGESCPFTGAACPLAATSNSDGTTTYACCPKDEVCPLQNPTLDDPCESLQWTCIGTGDQTCLPSEVTIFERPDGSKYARVTQCACAEPGTCGPFAIINDNALSCGVPPCPNFDRQCEIIVDNASRGPVSLFVSDLPVGAKVRCDCVELPCLEFIEADFTGFDNCNFCDDSHTRPEEARRSLGTIGTPGALQIWTRYGQVLATNTNGVGAINQASCTSDYTVSFTRNADIGEPWCIRVDTDRTGGITARDDGGGDAGVCLTGVAGTLQAANAWVIPGGTLSLPQVASCTPLLRFGPSGGTINFNPSNTSSSQSSRAFIKGVGPQTVSLNFHWYGIVESNPRNFPSFGNGDSVGIRIGEGTNCINSYIDTGVCTYPGAPPRSQTGDGHRVFIDCLPCPDSGCAGGLEPCRPAVDVCDIQECPSGLDCPRDVVAAAGATCRPLAGVCDVEETCTGSGPACPPDLFAGPETQCRPSMGLCDLPEYCNGLGPDCPPDDGARITECSDEDGCCPEGCTPAGDNDCRTPCPGGSDAECDDGLFCNGHETCHAESGTCLPATDPCLPDLVCDESRGACVLAIPPIPTVSAWGLMIMTLALLSGAKIYFARRPAVK